MTLLSLFGADAISLSEIMYFNDTTPDIIIWAAPVMFACVLVEYIISSRQNKGYYNKKETWASIGVGIGNVAISTSIKLLLFYMAVYIYNAIPWRMELSWWTFIPCYILYDFCSYWAHYISHNQRFWWATHIVHHSGEHYNLTVSFRLSWVQYFKIIFLFPVFFVGFHPVVFFVVNQIAILFQFWVHTEYIRKMPPIIEYIFATPSNHRVHHGSQEKYINKNYGATFIIWDRMFGTFQDEEEQVIYGVTSPIKNKNNPFYINFQEYGDMWRDVKAAKGWRQKLFFTFGSPENIAKQKKELTMKRQPRKIPVQSVEKDSAYQTMA